MYVYLYTFLVVYLHSLIVEAAAKADADRLRLSLLGKHLHVTSNLYLIYMYICHDQSGGQS